MIKKIFLFGLISVVINSCTIIAPIVVHNKTKGSSYTHKEYMSKYKTKSQVVRSFGVPTNKATEEGIEFYTYNKGQSTTSTDYGSARINSTGNRVTGSTVTRTNTYSKYVEFQFNSAGSVIGWRTSGLDYGTKAGNQYGVVAAGVIGLCLDLIGYLIYDAATYDPYNP